MEVCIHCEDELTDDNWYPSAKQCGCRVCKTCKNIIRKLNRRNATYKQKLRAKISSSMTNHKRKGIKVIGSLDEYVATYTGKCEYCGKQFDIFASDKYHTGSIDRINNDSIMAPDEVQWLCYECNRSKSNRSHEEYMEFIKMMYNKYIKEEI